MESIAPEGSADKKNFATGLKITTKIECSNRVISELRPTNTSTEKKAIFEITDPNSMKIVRIGFAEPTYVR
jgi:hypothetical protein